MNLNKCYTIHQNTFYRYFFSFCGAVLLFGGISMMFALKANPVGLIYGAVSIVVSLLVISFAMKKITVDEETIRVRGILWITKTYALSDITSVKKKENDMFDENGHNTGTYTRYTFYNHNKKLFTTIGAMNMFLIRTKAPENLERLVKYTRER